MESTEPALELRNVVKEYPGTPPVRALDGVSLRIDRGELAAIVGPSGSGKSTMLHVVGTLDRATSGQLLIGGRDVSDLDDEDLAGVRSRQLGFVFQQFFLLDGLDAVDNVATGLLYTGLRPAQRRDQAGEALRRVRLDDRRHHHPNQLSGGERQRVAIARALVNRPELVLADEPTGNLDTSTGAAIFDLLRDLNENEGATILVVTHNRELAISLPRSIHLRDGRVEKDERTALSPGPAGRS